MPQRTCPARFSFNPRLPGGRRHARRSCKIRGYPVSIHAFRGEGDDAACAPRLDRNVSIHAFRGEGDQDSRRCYRCPYRVSIHAFRGEGDTASPVCAPRSGRFNPRLPGGRRPSRTPPSIARTGFNPRLPGGRRLHICCQRFKMSGVSIHAFRGEGDLDRRAWSGPNNVSIHAFRGEGDWEKGRDEQEKKDVSIHAFRGEGDRRSVPKRDGRSLFQSTPSGGKATSYLVRS